jgi:hypothetical protein
MKEKMHMNVRSTWGTFTIVPHEIIESDLSPRAVLVFIALMSRVSHTEGDAKCWPSYEAIRERCAVKGREAINAGLDELEARGYLTRERRFSASTVYTLTRPVVQKANHSNSESELVADTTVVRNPNDSSSESEPQKFGIRTLTRTKNKKQRTRTNDSSRASRGEGVADVIDHSSGDESAAIHPPQEDDPFAFIPGVDDKPTAESIPAAPVEEKPKRARKSAAQLTPEESARHAELFEGIVRVCVVDAKLCGGHIARTAKQLREADPDANGAAMDAFLEWWKTSDFRGKQGKPPTIAQIPTSWKMFRDGYAERSAAQPMSRAQNRMTIDEVMAVLHKNLENSKKETHGV